MTIRQSFGILGPLAVGGMNPVRIAAPKQRTLLAILLLYANRMVSARELIEIVWEDAHPADARGALQIHVTRLRRRLAEAGLSAAIHSVPEGYLLQVPEDDLDLSRFRRLSARARQARRARDPHTESALLSEALALRRGQVLVDVPNAVLHRDHTPQVTEELLGVMERHFDVELALGHHSEMIADIRVAARAYPLRERLWGQLMLALYRGDRQAEALAAYRQIAAILRRDLGVDPGGFLVQLHQAILAGSPELATGGSNLPGTAGADEPADPAPAGGAWHTVFQLPANSSDFIGREDALSKISALLASGDADPGDAVRLVTVSGSPGVGKSAFAVYAARQLQEPFPDGQWYARLTGNGGAARDPADIISELLRASGLAPNQIPDGLEALTSTFRARLSGRKVLLVLDDAQDSEQVEPLLPGSPGNAVIVTGRDDLAALAALHGAKSIVLDVLSPAEAGLLLERLLGHPLTDAEAAAAAELGTLCGHLPLALRVAAANIAQCSCGLADYVSDLAKGDRLRKLAAGRDRRADIRTTFDAAYKSLPEQAQRTFRLLGALPVIDITKEAGLVLDAGPGSDSDDRRFNYLVSAHLLEEHSPGRYQLHDLLRLYAAEQANGHTRESDEARNRLFGWYLRSAHAAMDIYRPGLIRLPLPAPAAQGPTLSFSTLNSAIRWLDSERRNLVTIIEYASDHSQRELAWCLADAIRGYLWLGRYCPEWLNVARAGLRAAVSAGDQHGTNAMWYSLGLACRCLGRQRDADTHLRHALVGFQQAGEGDYEVAALSETGMVCAALGSLSEAETMLETGRARAQDQGLGHGMARALRGLADLHHSQGRLDEALRELTEALDVDRGLGIVHAEPENLRMLALVQADLGMLHEARAQLQSALASSDSVGARHERASILAALSTISTRSGRSAEAIAYGQRALDAAQEIGDLAAEAEALAALGAAHCSMGNLDMAQAHYKRAIETARLAEAHRTEIDALVGLSRVCRDARIPGDARDHARLALAGARRFGLRRLEGMALAALAAARLDLGEK